MELVIFISTTVTALHYTFKQLFLRKIESSRNKKKAPFEFPGNCLFQAKHLIFIIGLVIQKLYVNKDYVKKVDLPLINFEYLKTFPSIRYQK